MRKLLLSIFLLASLPMCALATEVTCFSGKTRIYHGYGNDFAFNESFMAFIEDKTKYIIIVYGDCILRTNLEQGEKINAIDLRKESAYA